MTWLAKSRIPSAAALAALGITLGLVLRTPPAPGIPPPSEICEGEASAILEGRTRREILAAWGEPDGTLSRFFGDVYRRNGNGTVVLYYDTALINEGAADTDTVPVLRAVFGET